LVVLGLVGITIDAIPVLPEQWTATIEANIAHANYTVHMREWHDAKKDRGRTDTWSRRDGGPVTIIYNFQESRYYRMDSSGCAWGTTDQLPRFSFLATTNASGAAHLTTTSNLWYIGGNVTDTYMGRKDVRGVACDWWQSEHICVSRSPNPLCDLNYTLDWYFSRPTWSSPESAATSIPIRVELKGTRLSRFNWHTQTPVVPPKLSDIWHVYDYVAFHVGSPASSNFERPCGVACQSINKTWDATSLPVKPCPAICTNDSADDSDGAENDNVHLGEESCNTWSNANVAGLGISMGLVGVMVGGIIAMFFGRLLHPSEIEVHNPVAAMAGMTEMKGRHERIGKLNPEL